MLRARWIPVFLLFFGAAAAAGPAGQARKTARLERYVDGRVDTKQLRAYHDLLSSIPHVAGSPGDLKVIDGIARTFGELGLEVERHEVLVYLPRPVSGSVRLVSPVELALPVKEEPVAGDPYLDREDLPIGWNAYSGNGTATATVVYANYGRKEDFERLAALGVDLTGKIVIARYGGNFRGYKAKFAEEAGAAGLVIYTDPADSGYVRGLMYPEGGYASPTYIQRGSILTLPYRGDPLTPFQPATADAERLDPADVALPRIPVQPVGWKAASEILSRMQGEVVPGGWQGGLPFTYRVTGGNALQVRVSVQQERRLVKTANVTGTLRGAVHPDQKIVFGAHHDAWGYGAADPAAGTILVLESARVFANAARKGMRPARSIIFATWGAEEHGIIGSVEWIEAHAEDLSKNAVAYLNADASAMGPNFSASSDPFLKGVIEEAAGLVPRAGDAKRTAGEDWLSRGEDPSMPGHPRFGDLGGGSDHIGFYCHLTIPSAGFSSGGSRGTSYHSLYDNLHWYRQVVGEDYEPARMLTRIASRVLVRLADAPVLPYDAARPAVDFRRHLSAISKRAVELDQKTDFRRLEAASQMYELRASEVLGRLETAQSDGMVSLEDSEWVDRLLIALTRAWSHGSGLRGRPWFRNLYAASDESSGYAPWMLPALRYAVEHRDPAALREAEELYVQAFRLMEHYLNLLDAGLREAEGDGEE